MQISDLCELVMLSSALRVLKNDTPNIQLFQKELSTVTSPVRYDAGLAPNSASVCNDEGDCDLTRRLILQRHLSPVHVGGSVRLP